MLDVEYARDLIFIGVLFGVAAFVWAGWGQERPPAGVRWRVLLGAVQLAGLGLVAIGVPPLIRFWGADTALTPDNPALLGYIIVFWVEVVVIVVLAIWLIRTKRAQAVAPMVLIVVGVHFFPLGFVFGQGILFVAGVLVTAAGVAALVWRRRDVAPSFWCGILAGPVFVLIGALAAATGRAAVGA